MPCPILASFSYLETSSQNGHSTMSYCLAMAAVATAPRHAPSVACLAPSGQRRHSSPPRKGSWDLWSGAAAMLSPPVTVVGVLGRAGRAAVPAPLCRFVPTQGAPMSLCVPRRPPESSPVPAHPRCHPGDIAQGTEQPPGAVT